MIDSETNRPVYHKYYKINTSKPGSHEPIEYEKLAGYIKKPDGTIHPILTSNPNSGDPIFAGTVTGTGFVVSKDGMIMTNANIVEKWTDSFQFDRNGVVLRSYHSDPEKGKRITDEEFDSLKNWNPSDVQYSNAHTPNTTQKKGDGQQQQKTTSNQPQEKTAKLIGANILLEVKFPGSDLRLKARPVVSSEKHNVALIRVDVASPIKALELDTNPQNNTVSGGERVVMLGYPAISSKTYISQKNSKNLNSNKVSDPNSVSVVDTASVAEGIVSKVPAHRMEGKKSSATNPNTFASRGDYIEMSMNYSGKGNSGGPVFNAEGKVIGIFTSNLPGEDIGANIGLAVPISYGLELLNPTQRIVK